MILFIFSFIWALNVSTQPWSFEFVELMSLLILLIYVESYGVFQNSKLTISICCVALSFFIPQQILLAQDVKKVYDVQQLIKKNFIESSDGLVCFPWVNVNITSDPYIFQWVASSYAASTVPMRLQMMDKPFIPLNSIDYQAVTEKKSFFTSANRVPGNVPAYYKPGGEYIWLDSLFASKAPKITAVMQPVDWRHPAPIKMRLSYVINPHLHPTTRPLSIDSIECRYGKFYRIPALQNRILIRLQTN